MNSLTVAINILFSRSFLQRDHMKLLDTSATAAAVWVVRDAIHAILAACHRPEEALELWQRTLYCTFQDLVCCVLAADPSSTFGVTFGEVAWRLMHVQHIALDAQWKRSIQERPQAAVATGAPMPCIWSPAQVLKAITATPDNTPGVSMIQNKREARGRGARPDKRIEVRARAMALLPLAASGAFGQENLLDPSCRPHTLRNACGALSTTAQRVDVLISVLCALCSQSAVLRMHACRTAESLLNAIDRNSAEEGERAVLSVATAISESQETLQASADALENVLANSQRSQATGMHHIVLHALCPCITDSCNSPEFACQFVGKDSVIPDVATSAVRACMTALAENGPHALRILFRIFCQEVGDAAAVVASHAYVPCIMKHVVALLEAGMPVSGLMGLALDILQSFQKLPEDAENVQVPDDVSKHMTAMHGDDEFTFSAGYVLRAVAEARSGPKAAGVEVEVAQHAHDITTSVRCACVLLLRDMSILFCYCAALIWCVPHAALEAHACFIGAHVPCIASHYASVAPIVDVMPCVQCWKLAPSSFGTSLLPRYLQSLQS